MMKELIVHIGYAKCATTFLQRQFFPKHPEINYLGRLYGENNQDLSPAKWVYDLSLRDDFDAVNAAESLRGQLKKERVNVFSHEVLLRPYKLERGLQRLKALSAAFDEFRIVVSVRKQSSLILSRHIHDIQVSHFDGELKKALDFEGNTECRWPVCSNDAGIVHKVLSSVIPSLSACKCRRDGVKYINLEFYNFHHLYNQLVQYFGDGHVHLIITENLRHAPAVELKRLTDFMGIQPLSEELINEISQRKENVTQMVQADRQLLEGEDVMKAAEEYFKQSNQLLAEQLQLDLRTLSYY